MAISGSYLNWRYLPKKAYVREYPQKIWPYMVRTYLHFRILEISHWIDVRNWLVVWNMAFMTFHILGIVTPTSPFLMGKSTISMAISNSKLLVYQRVSQSNPIKSPLKSIKSPLTSIKSPLKSIFNRFFPWHDPTPPSWLLRMTMMTIVKNARFFLHTRPGKATKSDWKWNLMVI